MCGIFGYIGNKNAKPILIEGLKSLEYRGYDSAGICLLEKSNPETNSPIKNKPTKNSVAKNNKTDDISTKNELIIFKRKGRVLEVEKITPKSLQSNIGIAHTRWATHGEPSNTNSHPHTCFLGKIAVVHNGIIENYASLKQQLEASGIEFKSQTDTEVVPHLISLELQKNNSNTSPTNSTTTISQTISLSAYKDAILSVVSKLSGAYALTILNSDFPDLLVCVRKQSPLVIGFEPGSSYVASCADAIANHTPTMFVMQDNEIAFVWNDKIQFYNFSGQAVAKKSIVYDESEGIPCLTNTQSYMLKEIREIPKAMHDTLKSVHTCFAKLPKAKFKNITSVVMVACGTAYNAGLLAKPIFESLTGLPTRVEIASEFRYANPLIDSSTLCIAISQSGETADTLAALSLAKERGCLTFAIVNRKMSTIAGLAEYVIHTKAGVEVAVASTKAYNAQLVALYGLAIYMGKKLGGKGQVQQQARSTIKELENKMLELPSLAREVIEREAEFKQISELFAGQKAIMFLGRGQDYATAVEASLKVKEITYIHCQAYPAGELKHGHIALIEKDYLVVAFLTNNALRDKMQNALYEVKARGAKVLALTNHDLSAACYDYKIDLPLMDASTNVISALTPLVSVIPLQFVSYFTARLLNLDADKPRNLAKSVTVE
ncbi:MAG: glutamine--fructose-6-phosphate transaminase (isomerizing) [Firmicutes bacterium]|nr:glutamine--fructose-6-phosphate transaminase (isomerizing) [Bacillota bacterium]